VVSTILVVEDDTDTAAFLRSGLEQSGYVVVSAADGQLGLEMARSLNADAIVLDRMLPGLDGLSLLETLRAERIDTPVIILSAIGSTDERVRGLRAGSDDYLVKPFALPELLARLDVLLRHAEPATARHPAAGVPDAAPRASGDAIHDLPESLELRFRPRHQRHRRLPQQPSQGGRSARAGSAAAHHPGHRLPARAGAAPPRDRYPRPTNPRSGGRSTTEA
jgi:DNA-binding response OmpR family regulator